MAEYSNYQKKVIQRFYDNRESGDEQRLAELVTNLYLSAGKKREKLWTQAEETMLRLKVPKKRVEHLIKTKDPAMIAEVVKELEAGDGQRNAIMILAGPKDVTGRIIVRGLEAQAFVHQIEKPVKADAGPPERIEIESRHSHILH